MAPRLATPVQAHKFVVVPNCQHPEISAVFTNSVRQAQVDLIKKTLTVSLVFSTDDGHTDAINTIINSGWIPELHFENGDMVFQFIGQTPPIQPSHSLVFDYSTTDIVKHVVVWSFGEFTLASFKGIKDQPLEPIEGCITIEDWHQSSESETKAP